MSNAFSPPGRTARGPAAPAAPQHVLATFPTYIGAEQLVDRLSDQGFPVEHARIIATACARSSTSPAD